MLRPMRVKASSPVVSSMSLYWRRGSAKSAETSFPTNLHKSLEFLLVQALEEVSPRKLEGNSNRGRLWATAG